MEHCYKNRDFHEDCHHAIIVVIMQMGITVMPFVEMFHMPFTWHTYSDHKVRKSATFRYYSFFLEYSVNLTEPLIVSHQMSHPLFCFYLLHNSTICLKFARYSLFSCCFISFKVYSQGGKLRQFSFTDCIKA
jgi:hypothetical protein